MNQRSSLYLEKFAMPSLRVKLKRDSVPKKRGSFSKFILLCYVFPLVVGCGSSGSAQDPNRQPASGATPGGDFANYPTANADDDRQIRQAQEAHMINAEVTGKAVVLKLLPDDRQGLQHQKFLLQLSNGTTILVAHDISYAPKVPIVPGDQITIHGSYIWNSKGGLIHWTHHSDSPRHEGGWIQFQGQYYQ